MSEEEHDGGRIGLAVGTEMEAQALGRPLSHETATSVRDAENSSPYNAHEALELSLG